MKNRRDQGRTVIVLVVFAIVALAAMATQYARMRAGQVPRASSPIRRTP